MQYHSFRDPKARTARMRHAQNRLARLPVSGQAPEHIRPTKPGSQTRQALPVQSTYRATTKTKQVTTPGSKLRARIERARHNGRAGTGLSDSSAPCESLPRRTDTVNGMRQFGRKMRKQGPWKSAKPVLAVASGGSVRFPQDKI